MLSSMGCKLCQVQYTGWYLAARVCVLRQLLVAGWRLSAECVCALTVTSRNLTRDFKRKCVDETLFCSH